MKDCKYIYIQLQNEDSYSCVTKEQLTDSLSYLMGWLVMLVFLSAFVWSFVSNVLDILSHFFYWRKHSKNI